MAGTLRPPLVLFCLVFFVSLILIRQPRTLYDPHAHFSADGKHPDSQRDTIDSNIVSSIIVPTFHERDNIKPLVSRLFKSLSKPSEAEVVIVDDDSRDGTAEVVETLRNEGYNVVLLIRTTGEKGLSSAVLRGFELARGEKLVVMDADLQHPPEYIQKVIDALDVSHETSKADAIPFALGTRYGEGVSMSSSWPLYRRVISWVARVLARPLTSASDPMSGFFGILKSAYITSYPLNTSGFKLGLEFLLKSPMTHIVEIPYSFATRTSGSSKLSSKVMIRYVGQLLTLYSWAWGYGFHLLLAFLFTGGVFTGVYLLGFVLEPDPSSPGKRKLSSKLSPTIPSLSQKRPASPLLPFSLFSGRSGKVGQD